MRRPGGHHTFEPALVEATDLRWTAAMYQQLATAERELGFLHGQVASRREHEDLTALACRREAVASCRLEGSQVTLADLMWYELDGRQADGLSCSPGEARVCANYAALLAESVPAEGHGGSLRRSSLTQLHSQLYRGVRGRDERAGTLRSTDIWLGPRGSTARTALYVPPAPEHLPQHLARLLAFAADSGALPPLARLALITYQLETLHPFVDGSGRVARLTMLRLLGQSLGPGSQSSTAARWLCPSVQLAQDVGGHFRQQQNLRQSGDWEGWVVYCAAMLSNAARAASATLSEGTNMLREHTELIQQQEPTIRATATQLLMHLAAAPLISVQTAAQVCQRTFANANLLVHRLEALGIVTEITGRQRHRRYAYSPYLALLQPHA